MKLTTVEVNNYRSFRSGHLLPLVEGLTCIVGPNNSGKSNLLQALGLVLGNGTSSTGEPLRSGFDQRVDVPHFPSKILPRSTEIRLGFQSEARPDDKRGGQERTLLRRAMDYERSTNPGLRPSATNAAKGVIVVRARFSVVDQGTSVIRHDYLAVPGVAQSPTSRKPPYPLPGTKEHAQFFREFHKSVRLVSIRSGEALESVLQGPLREVLEGVIQDHLTQEWDAAKGAREQYATHLRETLLAPLSQQISDTAGTMFPEVSAADLLPAIPELQETLSSMGVMLSDAIRSDLRSKGTGVRGSVLVAILRYLAEQSRRSLVLAIEEPESFLHPAAQEDLRQALQSLAAARDTTVLITTHSPFMLPRDPATGLPRAVGVDKDTTGRSRIDADPNRDHAARLFRDEGVSALLHRAQEIRPDARLVLITEGVTDGEYLRIAAVKSGREDLLEPIQIMSAQGATKLPALAVLVAQATAKPVVCLLDSDTIGKRAARILKDFKPQGNRVTLKLGAAPGGGPNPLVAEDLWPPHLRDQMQQELGHLKPADLKREAPAWFEANAERNDCARLVAVLEWIHQTASKASPVPK